MYIRAYSDLRKTHKLLSRAEEREVVERGMAEFGAIKMRMLLLVVLTTGIPEAKKPIAFQY